ncbi:MAG: LPXTG cell wall anchor domain-containing protein [Actinobacteria bacterium]|nr:LPXTG cell wall anchor domain-containing protein [Actinomycetota bacterium]MCA1739175.1 LPXTG cell wall anchor domain-containing protein [Actinomycetota bacterium]
MPKTGGTSTASLFALGAGTLLVGGGLLARRFIK